MDKQLQELLLQEEKRQQETITLIPSENYASAAVRGLVGSVFANKYSEGYPKRRYYQGNSVVDQVELLAIDRAKELFGVPHVNVQPYSGSPANSEVLFGLCEQGDTIMGMELASGGHLTHGQPKITFSGKYFNSVQFGVGSDGKLDYGAILELAREHKPKVMFIGTTAYPFILDWEKFSEIAKAVDSYLVCDVAHVVGLIAGGVYPTPVPFAHVITTTTHKSLRGPRGAMIMVTQKGVNHDPELAERVDRAVFPGLQGGPHNNTTAGIAQCLYEAAEPAFGMYANQIVKNANVLANGLKSGGLTLIGGGTESHLMLVDLRPQSLSGNVVAEALEVAGIVTNRNSVPGDTSPFYPSGIRLGTPAVTTRGMGEEEMRMLGSWVIRILDVVKEEKLPEAKEDRQKFLRDFKKRIWKDEVLLGIAGEVMELCKRFPVP